MLSLKQITDDRNSAVAKSRAILDRADREKRALNSEERAEYDRYDAEIDVLSEQIQQRQTAPQQRQAAPSRLQVHGQPGAGPVKLQLGNDPRTKRPREILLKPGDANYDRCTEKYGKAFNKYLSVGGREALDLKTSNNSKGGYLAHMQWVSELIKFLDNNVIMRQLCTVISMPSAVNIGVPTWDTDPADADWTAEVPASDISEDTTAAVGKREFMPHLLTKLVKMSQKLLRSSVVPMDTFIAERLGYKFAISEEQAFLTGSGAGRPLGCFVASASGISTGRDVTATNTTSFVADDLINVVFNCKEPYQKSGSWVMHRLAMRMARKLKDGNGQYLWQPGLAGTPNTLVDRPVFMSEYAPSTFTTGLYVALFGDFKAGYWIADALDMEVQRLDELFQLKNQVGIIARKETDGAPVLEEAFSRLILA